MLLLPLTTATTLALAPVSLTLDLKTAAICLIREGVSPSIAVPELYRFLDREGIDHPAPGSQAATRMWQDALNRASPAKCAQILRPIFDI